MRALPLLALLLAFAVSSAAKEPYPDRWVFVTRSLTQDAHVDQVRDIVTTSAEHGLNAMLLSGGLDGLGRWDEARLARLEQVNAICGDVGVELIPLGFSVGYGGSVLGHDANLAAGLPVKDALFVVADGEARHVAEPETSFPNGDLESFEGNQFAGLSFHDSPGEVSFVDQETAHGGDAAIRFENFGRDEHGHARLMATIKVRPHAHYLFTAWVKTENLQPVSSLRLQVYAEDRNIASLSPRVDARQDWTRLAFSFNSLGFSEVRLYAGLWGGREGKLWIDDLSVEEVGLRCIIRRPGTPLTVTSEDGAIEYEEGRDFAEVTDPQLRDFRGDHEDPAIQLLPGSRIADGQRLRVSFYHAAALGSGQVSVCMSEPALYDYWHEQVQLMHERLAPAKYFLSMDEIRAGGSCEACKARGMTMGEILGDCITKQCEIIREVSPEATIYIWSDMLDPNHNAHGDYYLVDGDFTGSWEHVPKDLVIVCWYHAKRDESLGFFSGLGFETLAGAYYDGDTLDNPREWLEALAQTPKARGIMYTTWQSKYGLLAGFGDLVSAASGAAPE